jgi:hypothetical protein
VLWFGIPSLGCSPFLAELYLFLACALTRRYLWSFLLDTLWPRFYQRSVKDQSTYTTSGMAYFRLLAPSVVARLFGCFGLLDAGPYRLEGGGVRSGFILPLGLKRSKVV